MKKFINGKKKKVKKETIDWWAKHGNYKIQTVFTYSNSSWNKYDTAIVAFNNYWISKLDVSKKLRVNPNYVKAMVYNESTMGETNSKDVMTVFNSQDPAIHVLARTKKADPNEGVKYGLPKDGYGAVKNLFSKNKVVKSRITSNLSICFGIRWLYYKTQIAGTVKGGIEKYNGGGDPKYMSKIKKTLEENKKSSLIKEW